jgi:N-acetylglucosaminyldiphosphoundecaprenol N-acetyl-beta-D-mannosaminyltransferase
MELRFRTRNVVDITSFLLVIREISIVAGLRYAVVLEMNETPLDYITFCGINVHTVRADSVIKGIRETISLNGRMLIAGINADLTNLSYREAWLREFMNSCDIVFCDGIAVKWGAKLLGTPLPARIPVPDWIDDLMGAAEKNNIRLFLLGASEEVMAAAKANLESRYPRLSIVGSHHGYFEKRPDSSENTAVVRLINESRPDVVLVGMSVPVQERWLWENWERLTVPVALVVGAVFEMLAGTKRRPPRWMTDHGLEWLGRLLLEPRRLWKRYLIGNPRFVAHVLRERFRGSG